MRLHTSADCQSTFDEKSLNAYSYTTRRISVPKRSPFGYGDYTLLNEAIQEHTLLEKMSSKLSENVPFSWFDLSAEPKREFERTILQAN